jgi:hypothetical protein
MLFEIFEAFTGLAAILGAALVAVLFLCARDIEQDAPRDWTLRRRRSPH